MSEAACPAAADALSSLLPPGTPLDRALDGDGLAALESAWRTLTELGFQVHAAAERLTVRHPRRGFEATVELSRPDDLGELRRLFLALRAAFGRRRDRWLPWLFLPGPDVTVPYEHLRTVVEVCGKLRVISDQ